MAKFRTEIEVRPASFDLEHDKPIVMLGSCFTDNVGSLLERDGFCVTHNPMGPLYNPASILNAIELALGMGELTLMQDANGIWHCLDFASRYSDANRECLIEKTKDDLQALCAALRHTSTLILTLGTSYVFQLPLGPIVGNCHKFPPQTFVRKRLAIEEITACLLSILSILPDNIEHVIFTVSPIRHVGDGLHANQLSKASLLLAIDEIISYTDTPERNTMTSPTANKCHLDYFPAYELVLDDLRDYRFYASDMKHPSEVAIDYIYEKFSQTYFSPITLTTALAARKQFLRESHRQIL